MKVAVKFVGIDRSGYLPETTGTRRFWNVRVPGSPDGASFPTEPLPKGGALWGQVTCPS